MNEWYCKALSQPDGWNQGLVIDSETGDNIAVAYELENAKLIANLPALIRFVDDIERYIEAGNISTKQDKDFVRLRIREARDGIIP